MTTLDNSPSNGNERLPGRLLEQLFDGMPTAVVVSEPATGRILSVNRAFADLVGHDVSDVVGGAPPYPWGRDAPTRDLTSALNGARKLEALFRHANGRLMPVELTRFELGGEGGRVPAVVDLVVDLSERRRFEQQLVQSGKLAAIGELAAGVAHEINNPLFAILGLTEFLLEEAEPGSKAHERLALIQTTGFEIKEIVRGLLDFARDRSDERAEVSLRDVAGQTIELLRRTNAAKNVEIAERYADDPCYVEASSNQLKQIFINLISNARQAMRHGGTITVDVGREGRSVVASVHDTGPGIPGDALGRVFEPFYTTKRDVGGTGLGLSVSLGIAQAHGGSLTVSSPNGEGACFTLTLPASEGAK